MTANTSTTSRAATLSIASQTFTVTQAGATSPAGPWVQRFGSTGPDVGRAVAVDGTGNVVVAGAFQGTVDFGGGPLVSAGGFDMFIAKYSASGAHLWSKRFGGAGAETARSIGLDASGNIFVAGSLSGTSDVGGGTMVSAGAQDIFVAKYSATGGCLWAKQIGGTYDNDVASSLAVDGSGNVIVTGVFQGAVDFGGGVIYSKYSGTDTFLAKYSGANGSYLWAENFAQDGGADEGTGVAVDSTGNIVLTGIVNGTIDLGGGPSASPLGMNKFYVAKFSSAGAYQWSQFPTVPLVGGSQGASRTYGVAVDGGDNVFITGTYSMGIDFGGGVLTSLSGQFDVFLAKYSPAGTYQWAKSFPGAGNEQPGANGIAVDRSGNVAITGYFPFNINLGGGVLSTASVGVNDAYVAKYSSSGAYLWAERVGGTDNDQGQAIVVDATGHVLVSGSFSGTADFGGQSLSSAGSSDAFLLRLDP